MKCSDFTLFQKHVKDPFSLCLIVAKEENDRKKALAETLMHKKEPVSSFSAKTFFKESFFQELETLPFLTKQKIVVLTEVEELEAEFISALSQYCLKPNPWIFLILSASHLTSQNKVLKACEKTGVVFFQEEEKPWEKEKRLERWVIEEIKKNGLEIEPQAIFYLVQYVDTSNIRNELEKLICYMGGRGKISLKDVQNLSHFHSHDTIWQLVDVIFRKDTPSALQVFGHLMENEGDVFLILASLRGQIQTAYQSLILQQEQGKEAVTKAYPYLKGTFLEKKLKAFQEYGLNRLKKAHVLIFETEIRLKNLSQDPRLIFEILLSKLTNDSLSSSKFARM